MVEHKDLCPYNDTNLEHIFSPFRLYIDNFILSESNKTFSVPDCE